MSFYPVLIFGRTLAKPKDKKGYFDYITTDEFFEADLFSLFEEIMIRDLKELYTYNNDRFKHTKNTPFDKENVTLKSIEESEGYRLRVL